MGCLRTTENETMPRTTTETGFEIQVPLRKYGGQKCRTVQPGTIVIHTKVRRDNIWRRHTHRR